MKKIILLLLVLCYLDEVKGQLTNLTVGSIAPDFTVTDLEGKVHTRAEFAGKFLMVDLFFTTCGPCKIISPILNEFYVKYGCNGYNIQVLSVETSTNNAATRAYETSFGGDQNHLTTTVSGIEGGGIDFLNIYHASAFPTVFLIGSDGLIKSIDIWPISNIENLENAIISAGGTSSLVAHTCSTSGIEEIILSTSKLYPNPINNSVLHFEFNNKTVAIININVLDVLGQTIYSKEFSTNAGLNKLDFDFTEFPSGKYFFKATKSDGIFSSQIFQIK